MSRIEDSNGKKEKAEQSESQKEAELNRLMKNSVLQFHRLTINKIDSEFAALFGKLEDIDFRIEKAERDIVEFVDKNEKKIEELKLEHWLKESSIERSREDNIKTITTARDENIKKIELQK